MGDVTRIEHRHGSYILKISYFKASDSALVIMSDVSLRFPQLWSRIMTWEHANAVAELFEMVGFFNVF